MDLRFTIYNHVRVLQSTVSECALVVMIIRAFFVVKWGLSNSISIFCWICTRSQGIKDQKWEVRVRLWINKNNAFAGIALRVARNELKSAMVLLQSLYGEGEYRIRHDRIFGEFSIYMYFLPQLFSNQYAFRKLIKKMEIDSWWRWKKHPLLRPSTSCYSRF